jgi:hypothetical protein
MNTDLISRNANHNYSIKGYYNHLYWTGVVANDDQVLVVVNTPIYIAVRFNDMGALLSVEQGRLSQVTIATGNRLGIQESFRREMDQDLLFRLHGYGYKESIIHVNRFFLTDYHIGIVDFANCFVEVLESPDAFSTDEVQLAKSELTRWSSEGVFELWLNDSTNLWLTHTGEVESS